MESNWRWNVFEFGEAAGEFRKIARCLPGPYGGLIIGQKDDPHAIYRAVLPAPGQLAVWFGPDFWPTNFPWYFAVEPDSPS